MSIQPTENQLVIKRCKEGASLDSRRALVRPQKGPFCKPISRLLEAKRACIGFELHENSLQESVGKGINCL